MNEIDQNAAYAPTFVGLSKTYPPENVLSIFGWLLDGCAFCAKASRSSRSPKRPLDRQTDITVRHSIPFRRSFSWARLRANSFTRQLRGFCFPGSSLKPLGPSQNAAARFRSGSPRFLDAPGKWGKKGERHGLSCAGHSRSEDLRRRRRRA
jgi:hypothetical protein